MAYWESKGHVQSAILETAWLLVVHVFILFNTTASESDENTSYLLTYFDLFLLFFTDLEPVLN